MWSFNFKVSKMHSTFNESELKCDMMKQFLEQLAKKFFGKYCYLYATLYSTNGFRMQAIVVLFWLFRLDK